MSSINVSLISNPKLHIEVNFKDTEWAVLHSNNIAPFKLVESIRKCSAYPEGIFPGSTIIENDKQVTIVHKFLNLIEFSKVISDDILTIDGQAFLTTKFYDSRKIGLASNKHKIKYGEAIGYNINGDLYSHKDKNLVECIFYNIVYKPQIIDSTQFKQLQKYLMDGIGLFLTDSDTNFLKHIASILVNSTTSEK